MIQTYTNCKRENYTSKTANKHSYFILWLFVFLGLSNFSFANENTALNQPTVVATPENISYETYGVGMTALVDWVEANGGAVIEPAAGCGPAVWTNNYSMSNFNATCGFYTGSISVTFSYSDACGNSLNFTRTATLFDETPPTCVKPYDLSIACDAPNADETIAAYAAYWGPVTDLNHPITVTSSYTADGFDANGAQEITWTFTDACANVTTLTSVLTVTGDCDCTASAGTKTADQAEVALSAGSANISATPDGNAVVPEGYSVIYVLTSGSDLLIQQVNTDEAAFTVTEAGLYTIHCLVYDPTTLDLGIVTPGVTTGFDVFGLTTAGGGDICASLDATGAPVTVTADMSGITITPPQNYNLSCEEPVPGEGVEATTTCPDGGINVVVSENVVTGDCPGEYVLTRTYTVTDNCNNSETATQTIEVSDNTPPVFFFVPPTADVDCTAYPDGFGEPGVGEACGEYTLTFEDQLEDYICDADFNITRTWTATDQCGNVATASQTLVVWPDIEAPTFTFVPADATIVCPATPEFGEPTIEDACLGFTVTEEITSTGTCPGAYTTTKTWTATDECGNTSVESQTITVLEQPAPVALGFTSVPQDKTVSCSVALEFDAPVCASNCEAGFELTFSDSVEEGVCAGIAVHKRTWTATDGCDNIAVCEQNITVEDDENPEFATASQELTMTELEYASWITPVVEATDECSNVELVGPNVFQYNDKRIGYSWTAYDACGNKESMSIIINLEQSEYEGALEITYANGLTVYPNPTSNLLNVGFESATATDAILNVVDMNGKVTYTQTAQTFKGRNQVTLNVNELPQGTYFVEVITNGDRQVKRFVKF